jgi:hypothetical protein
VKRLTRVEELNRTVIFSKYSAVSGPTPSSGRCFALNPVKDNNIFHSKGIFPLLQP